MTLQTAGVVWADLGAGGTSDPFTITSSAQAIEVASTVLAIDAGNSLTVFADIQDTDGNWIQATALTAQTTPGTQTALVASLGAVTPNFTSVARLRWTTTAGSVAALLVAVGR